MILPFNLELANRTYFGMCKQERIGVAFNQPKAQALLERADAWMEQLEQEIEPLLPKKEPNIGEAKALTPPKLQFKKDGSPSANAEKWFDSLSESEGIWYGVKKVGDSEVSVTLPHHEPILDKIPMKMKDQQDIKDWLMSLGWKPTLWNVRKQKDEYGKMRIAYPIEKTTPKFHENGELCPNLEALGSRIKLIKPIITYLSLKNRRAVVSGWLGYPRLKEDGRLPAVSTGLTNTHRQKHSVVANVPKAKDGIVLGKEMRELFTTEQGRVAVGYDASALEARVKAHYCYPYSKEYAEKITAPDFDVHQENADNWGLDRDEAKAPEYCLAYGGQLPRFAATLGKPVKEAEPFYNIWWDTNWPLGKLKEDLETQWFDNGKKYIIGLDGSKVYTRSQHSLINTLFQNAGAVIMDLSVAMAESKIEKLGLDAKRVIYYHDEAFWDCHPDVAEQVGEIGVWSIKKAGEYFKLNVPLDADYSIGESWKDVH